jgi:hypothetical protein
VRSVLEVYQSKCESIANYLPKLRISEKKFGFLSEEINTQELLAV